MTINEGLIALKEEYTSLDNSLGLTSIRSKRDQIRIACISDLHLPFHCEEALDFVVEREEGADVLVINGDWLDCHCASSFRKNKYVSLLDEYNIALAQLQVLSPLFGKIVIVAGNHDGFRIDRLVDDKIPEGAQFLFRKPILKRLAEGEVLSEDGEVEGNIHFGNVIAVPGPPHERWYCRIGNTVFCHPMKNSKIEGKTSEHMLQYFRDRMDGIDSIVVAHTHKLNTHYAHGFLCMEGGCLSLPLDYALHPSAKFSPQTIGYSVIIQDKKGNTDYNLSHQVYCGVIRNRKEVESIEI